VPNYPKYKIRLRFGEVFAANIKSVDSTGLAKVELPNTSVLAHIDSNLQAGDELYLVVRQEKPLELVSHSVLLSPKEQKHLTEERIEDIKRILNLQHFNYVDQIIVGSSKVSKRIIKSTCYEISEALSGIEYPDLEESIYIMNLMGDSRIPVSASSFNTVSVLFQSQNVLLAHLVKALQYLVDAGLVDSRIAMDNDNKYNTNLQYLLDYHSPEGLYKLLILNGLTDDRFTSILAYFDALLYWNSAASVSGSPLLVPLVVRDLKSVFGIRLIHLWFTKLNSKSTFLFNDIFRLKAEMENGKMEVTYDASKLEFDSDKLSKAMDKYGYRLQGYNLDNSLIFLDRNRNLSPLSSDTTFVV
jgi:hypothetical protein